MASEEKVIVLTCASKGPRNNGLIENCAFIEKFPDTGYKYNCPVCNSPMKRREKK